MTPDRRWLLTVALLLTAGLGAPVTELPLGQAVWRPQAATVEVPGPDGAPTTVTADLWGIALTEATRVVVRMHTVSGLGLVVRDLDHPQTRPLAVLAPNQPYAAELPAGRYLLTIAGQGGNGPYILSAAKAPAPARTFQGGLPGIAPDDALRLLGRFDLGAADGLALGPAGRWVATWRGEQGWLHDLDAGASYAVPKLDGPLLRIAFADDGWSLLTVTTAGAVAASMPELAPFARFTAQTGVRDAVPAPDQRVVLLPADAPAYVASPSEEDLAYLPGTRGAAGLVPGHDDVVGLWYADQTVQLLDVLQRRELGRAKWPNEPLGLALQPGAPVLFGSGAAQTLSWRAGSPTAEQVAGGAAAVACHVSGTLALASPTQVALLAPDGQTTVLEPAVAAVRLAFNAPGHRLAGQTASGEVLVWDTIKLLGHAANSPAEQLLASRSAYNEGLAALKAQDYATARAGFVKCRDLLADLPADGDVAQFRVLALLRLSQASYLLHDYAASLSEAEAYLTAAKALPDGEFKTVNVSQALYRRADALWELGRKTEAKQGYQAALDAGLTGLPAEDAKAKVTE